MPLLSLLPFISTQTSEATSSSSALERQRQLRRDNNAAYVLRDFPDRSHDAAIVLSQSDEAPTLFERSFDAASRGDGRALRAAYELLLQGARSEPGAIEDASAGGFPGVEGVREKLRRQLHEEFGADPLAEPSGPAGTLEVPSRVGGVAEGGACEAS